MLEAVADGLLSAMVTGRSEDDLLLGNQAAGIIGASNDEDRQVGILRLQSAKDCVGLDDLVLADLQRLIRLQWSLKIV